jgi:hypothetical protein
VKWQTHGAAQIRRETTFETCHTPRRAEIFAPPDQGVNAPFSLITNHVPLLPCYFLTARTSVELCRFH